MTVHRGRNEAPRRLRRGGDLGPIGAGIILPSLSERCAGATGLTVAEPCRDLQAPLECSIRMQKSSWLLLFTQDPH
jgi:hypothetical protein